MKVFLTLRIPLISVSQQLPMYSYVTISIEEFSVLVLRPFMVEHIYQQNIRLDDGNFCLAGFIGSVQYAVPGTKTLKQRNPE